MTADILTVMWKERKGLFRVRGRRSQALLAMLSPVFLAVYMPWQEGAAWVRTAWSLLIAFIVPLILVGITIPDSFAGERERHTLRTLLASRLPDRAILFGKMATAVAFGWGATLILLLVSLVTVNVLHWQGRVLLYTPTVALAGIAVSLLVALLTAAVGVLFSLRASTVQEAQQSTMGVLLALPMLLQFASLILLRSGFGSQWLNTALEGVTLGKIVLGFVAVLVLLDMVLLWMAMARFKRARLILG
jgi:ABC-2 type transport system permease protein